MICAYCHKDPGAKPNGVWKGFRDGETHQLVCWGCRELHYRTKFKDEELKDTYSEFPQRENPPSLKATEGRQLNLQL